MPHFSVAAAAPPSTPLGPWVDSAVSWTTWITLMGSVGLAVLALAVVAAPARRAAPGTLASVTVRLAPVAAVLSALAVPAVLANTALADGEDGGYDWAAAWDSVYDGSVAGLYLGLQVTFSLIAAALLAALAVRAIAGGPARNWVLGGGVAASAVALAMAKFPDALSETDPARTVLETIVWMMHNFGAAVWLGGLAGLVLLALPGAVAAADRGAFWSSAIRRFSVAAMTCVALVFLSGLFLYWEHVDGPEQLFTTMYGRTVGVKLIIFGVLLLLGIANQFFLHPRIEALRVAGDQRNLAVLVTKRFPVVVTAELLLVMLALFVAPFLAGSARQQAYQAQPSVYSSIGADGKAPKITGKESSAATWIEGTAETLAVVAVMVVGYRVSGRIARRRVLAVTTPAAETPDDAVGV